MANQNIKAVIATVSGSYTYSPGTEIEGWIFHNLDSSNTLTFNVGGQDVKVQPGGWKRVDCIDPGIIVTGNGEFNVIALEDGEAEIERLATGSGSGGGSTPAPDIVTAATTSGSPYDITAVKTVSRPATPAPAFFRLPDAATATPGEEYLLKDGAPGIAGSHVITVTAAGGTIDGQTSTTLPTDLAVKSFFSDGTNWNVI